MRPYRLKARRNGFRPTKPGDLVRFDAAHRPEHVEGQMDAVYVFDNGIKRHIDAVVERLRREPAWLLCYLIVCEPCNRRKHLLREMGLL